MLSEELKVYRKYGGQFSPKCSIICVPQGIKFRITFLKLGGRKRKYDYSFTATANSHVSIELPMLQKRKRELCLLSIKRFGAKKKSRLYCVVRRWQNMLRYAWLEKTEYKKTEIKPIVCEQQRKKSRRRINKMLVIHEKNGESSGTDFNWASFETKTAKQSR